MSNAGYSRIAARLEEIHLCGSRVAVQESLDETVSPNGLVGLSKQATVVGRVLALGDKVEEDLQVGDLVLYEQWQGGRWLTADGIKLLIMDADKVALILERPREGWRFGQETTRCKEMNPWGGGQCILNAGHGGTHSVKDTGW